MENNQELQKTKKSIEEHLGTEIQLITEKDKFEFKCNSCGKCCSNDTLDMILFSPLDLYNLSKGLNIKVEDVLKKYCNIYIGKNSNLPVVQLKSIIDTQKSYLLGTKYTICPFLKDNKCSVHNFKPNICKLYPLGRSASIDVKTNEQTSHYFLLKNHCGGKGEKHNLDNWINNRVDDERLLNERSSFINKVLKIMNFKSINKIMNEVPGLSKTLDMYYNFFISLYYANYDANKPFWEQYEKNQEEILEKTIALKKGMSSILDID